MDDFNFYLKFSKPLVLNLPHPKDRAIAALWVKKLRDMQPDGPEANMRIEYLKLLLFVMQRNKLTGIFEKPPPEGPLQGFPSNYKATDMLSLVKPEKTSPPAYPPVYTSVGGDLCQFVAVQEIPNFGLHGYYAISMEPLSKWSHPTTNAARKTMIKPKHRIGCGKYTCNKLAESTYCAKKCKESDSATADQEQPQESSRQNSQTPLDSKSGEPSENAKEPNDCEKITGPVMQCVPFPPIPYQTFRKEIAGFESRPTWGRSRYIERLIDESPHLTADLDVSQADAMLRVISDKVFKKADKYGPCALSDTRRRVEQMMDLPPCAIDPGVPRPNLGPTYTCCPKREKVIDIHCTDICQSESDFYPCGKRSVTSLRGGSDSGSCCAPRNQNLRSRASGNGRDNNMNSGRRSYAAEFSHSRERDRVKQRGSARQFGKRQQRLETGSILDDTDDPLDVDTTIHDAVTTSRYIDPNKSGNFKWLEEIEHIALSDHTETSFTESDSRSRMLPFTSNTTTNDFYHPGTEGCSEFDEEPPINEQLHPEELMPQVAQRMHSSKLSHSRRSPMLSQQSPGSCSLNTRSYNQGRCGQQMQPRYSNASAFVEDSYEEDDVEPSIAVVRRKFAKSREATKRKPEIHEKTYRWKEIIDQTHPRSDQTIRSKGVYGMSNYDPEYLDYIEAIKTDDGCCYEDEEEMEEPRYSSRTPGQMMDEEMVKYTRKMLRPPKPPPSSGRVIIPLSKQNRRRQKAEELQYEQIPDENADEEKSELDS